MPGNASTPRRPYVGRKATSAGGRDGQLFGKPTGSDCAMRRALSGQLFALDCSLCTAGLQCGTCRSQRPTRRQQSLHCCLRRCVLESWADAFAERRFLARVGPAACASVAASPTGLRRTADAQELGRHGSGSVGARVTAVPVRELTLSTQSRIRQMRNRRRIADAQGANLTAQATIVARRGRDEQSLRTRWARRPRCSSP